jgi:cytochrome o ubiquinol oxidase subunit 2
VLDVAVMLGIIIPTAIITTYFLLRYRKTSTTARYEPNWSHSNLLELIVWAVHFHMTSATVVNDFYIPKLAGMIDIMPGMRTKQVLVADKLGQYKGYSANFSGAGFSWMGFKTHVVSKQNFQAWVQQAQGSHLHMNYAQFNKLAKPTTNTDGKTYEFSHVRAALFHQVIKGVMMGKVYTTSLPPAGAA